MSVFWYKDTGRRDARAADDRAIVAAYAYRQTHEGEFWPARAQEFDTFGMTTRDLHEHSVIFEIAGGPDMGEFWGTFLIVAGGRVVPITWSVVGLPGTSMDVITTSMNEYTRLAAERDLFYSMRAVYGDSARMINLTRISNAIPMTFTDIVNVKFEEEE